MSMRALRTDLPQQAHIDVLFGGLGFPEGPLVASDGTIYVCDIHGGLVLQIRDGQTSVLAALGGGPNGLALGPDSWLYVANNGGAMRWAREDGLLLSRGFEASGFDARIERIHLTDGRVERVLDRVDGRPLQAIDDLVFNPDGSFWFTDLGRDGARSRTYGGIYWCPADGGGCREVVYPLVNGANGIGLAPGGKTLYATEYGAGRLWAWQIAGPGQLQRIAGQAHGGRLLWQAPAAQLLDSLAMTASGNIIVAVQPTGLFAVIAPDGRHLGSVRMPEHFPTNLCFDPAHPSVAYATLSSTGSLARMDWPEPGLGLAFNR